jgi:hypothetical protein
MRPGGLSTPATGRPLGGAPPKALMAAVTAEARANAATWFTGLDPASVRIQHVSSDARARCLLHRMELDDGVHRRPVLVKVRHSIEALRRREVVRRRPQLVPERTISDQDAARCEYDGLRLIADALADSPTDSPIGRQDGPFGTLRPLAWLGEHAAIVLPLVEEPTLRQRLLATSRTRPRRAATLATTPWENAGAWLRVFQSHAADADLPTLLEGRAELVERLRAYVGFLGEHPGPTSRLSRVDEVAADLVAATMPARLPQATGHGDFVANNIFVSSTGRVTVFDPLPRWRVPVLHDLATLTVGLRALPVQATSQGLALPGTDLATYESALLHGYFADEPVPVPALATYQLLVLLDRWSDLVSKRSARGGVHARLSTLRVRAAARHYARQADRLLGLATGQAAPT